ncbi:hypothetical protein AAHN97_17590 [Chitinophaga niabensis]|uniref:hypothetical protein n=1 Tax=Chitinophaga niabensis TaxID=536979 RepID=UPI0031BB79A0
MITLEKLDIYKRYDGSVDGWSHSGSSRQKQAMTDKDWFVIESFIQDLTLVKRGLASESFQESLNNRLKGECDNEGALEEIKRMIK